MDSLASPFLKSKDLLLRAPPDCPLEAPREPRTKAGPSTTLTSRRSGRDDRFWRMTCQVRDVLVPSATAAAMEEFLTARPALAAAVVVVVVVAVATHATVVPGS
jgi:hypothetical protein